MIWQDYIAYPDDDAPDIGSITPISNDNGVREYRLLAADLDKLNSVVTYCGTGSTAFICSRTAPGTKCKESQDVNIC